jgi:protein TonB
VNARSPTAFLAVCALHAVLVWAVLASGRGPAPASPARPSPVAWGLVPVTLVATARPVPAAPKAAPLAAAKSRQQDGAVIRRPAAAERPTWAPPPSPAAVPDASDPAASLQTVPAAEQPTAAEALPAVAQAQVAIAPAAAVDPTPIRAKPIPAPPAPRILADAVRQSCPPASHPAALRERGIEGSVLLRVKVDAHGRPAEVQLQSSSGWRLFDEAALRQARACRFTPATQDGQAIDSWVEFPVRFALVG